MLSLHLFCRAYSFGSGLGQSGKSADILSMGASWRYQAFGLHIHSEIELPELLTAGQDVAQPIDLIIARGSVKQRCSATPTSAAEQSPLMWVYQNDIGVEFAHIGRFAVVDGHRIEVDLCGSADASSVRLFLLGPVLALLLHQRGLLVLHASAVSIDGQVVAFAAEKGEGKSTFAAAMHARGHAIFTDDLLPIDLKSEPLLVAPAYPQLKLYPEAAAQLSDAPQDLARVHCDYEKRAQPVPKAFPTQPQPLSMIYILETADLEAIDSVSPQQRFVELIRHSYLAPLMTSTGESAKHFSQVVQLAQRVPLRKLLRRRDLTKLSQVAQRVEADLRQPAAV